MKKSIITIYSLFVSTGLIASNVASAKASELSWVNEQVEAIKPARIGAKNYYLGSIKDPFIFLKKTKKKSGTSRSYVPRAKSKTSSVKSTTVASKKPGTFTLGAIINKSALIGGKWYKEGQTVHGYKLEKVNAKFVFLKKNTKTLILSTKSENRSLKFNNN